MKIATSILICSAIVQCYPNSVDKRSSSNDAKSDGIWIDSNYVSKNQNIINPSIAEGVCKFIKNCISSDMGAFNHMALPLNKNGGDFEIKVDSFGRYSGATTYYGVPEPGFDKYFRKEIIFKSNYINSELHGTYKIDSNENITVFRILAQKLPDTYREITSKNGKSYTPPIKIISKPGSLIPLSSRKLEQVQNAIIIDSANFIRTSNASSDSGGVSVFDMILSINPLGKVYAMRVAESIDMSNTIRLSFMQGIKNIDFGIDSFGVQNLRIHVEAKSSSISFVKATELFDLPQTYWMPNK